MKRIDLNRGWRAECVGRSTFDTALPSCTINVLVENGYLPRDLLSGKNADAVQKFENDDWVYTSSFTLGEVGDRAFLSFRRIDTYADIFLNGAFLAHVENGNISHTFDVSEKVIKGENTLKVCLFSPVTAVKELPKLPGAFTTERLNTRREQCTYGWDWVARFVCCGLGEAEFITYKNDEAIVKHAYIFTESVQARSALVKIETTFEDEVHKPLFFEILSKSGEMAFAKKLEPNGIHCELCAEISDAELWYPVGYGEQPLYTLRIRDGKDILHEERFGIRTLEILQLPDEKDGENYRKCLQIQNPYYDLNKSFSGFTLVINGVKIMCKGANWVPCQPYQMNGREEKITTALTLGVEMGLNMLRVWGGGSFECKHFYDECSRLGILVTQDFLMACGSYPEKEEWFLKHLQKEAEYACILMRNQPCLVWYSGDNENAVDGSFEMEDYRGKTAFEKGLKPVVDALDRKRAFWASSPYGGNKFASNTVGTTHNTNFLTYLFDYIESKGSLDDYKEELKKYRARFIAEEPIFGAVSLPSLRRFMKDEEIFCEDTDMWLYHSKGNPALKKELMEYMLHFCEKVLGTFKDPYDRYFKFKYFQYEWLRVVMEQARREKWFCSGIVFWMFNDCWTAASGWALIDYFNTPKLAYYAFKRCAKPVLCSIDREGGRYVLHISNDGLEACCAEVEISKLKDGNEEKISTLTIDCPSNGNTKVDLTVELKQDEILLADMRSSHNSDRAFYKQGALHLIPADKNAVEWHELNGEVLLTAHTYIHAIELCGKTLFTDNGFSMKKGEQRRIGVLRSSEEDTQVTLEAYTLQP